PSQTPDRGGQHSWWNTTQQARPTLRRADICVEVGKQPLTLQNARDGIMHSGAELADDDFSVHRQGLRGRAAKPACPCGRCSTRSPKAVEARELRALLRLMTEQLTHPDCGKSSVAGGPRRVMLRRL